MAKSKVTEGEVEVDGAETVANVEVAVKAFRFEVLAGSHSDGEISRVKGDIFQSEDDLVAIHGSTKFRRLE